MKKLLTLIACVLSLGVQAQYSLTTYNMKSLPQRRLINPALIPDCKWHIGMPALNSVEFNFTNNAFDFSKINNAMVPNYDGKNTFMVNTFVDNISEDNYLSFTSSINWLDFGFRLGQFYFGFNANEHIDFRGSYSGDIFRLIGQGNGGDNLGKTFSVAPAIDLIHYRDYGLSVSRSFMNNKLSVGARLRYLYGLNNIQTAQNDVTFYTDPNDFSITVSSDLEFNSSTILDSTEQSEGGSPYGANLLSGSGNNGWGADIGGAYHLTDRVSINLAVKNLGYIKWTKNTVNTRSKNPGASITYSGIEMKDFFADSTELQASFEELGDSLMEIFELEQTHTSYTSRLFPELYLGASFHLTQNHHASLLVFGQIYQGKFYPGFNVAWNSRLTKFFNIAVSYSMINKSYTNVGLGASLNLGPVQLYLVSDNFPSLFSIASTKTVSARFGLNFTVGRELKSKDNPRPIF